MKTRSFAKRIAVAAVVMAALLAVAAPALSSTSPVVVQGATVSGFTVQVSIRNTSSASWKGYVGVKAMVGDTPIWSFVPVSLMGGQSMTTAAGFAGPVTSLASVGITDDPNPIL